MNKYTHYIKYSIKNIIAYFLYYTGILFYLKNKKLSNKCIVLTYHRILPIEMISESFSNSGIIVQPDTFKRHLKFLQKHFKIEEIDEFYNSISQCKSTYNPPCLITFDDGWIDNYLYAFPILKNMNVTATIFLPTAYIQKNDLFWQEKLCHLLYRFIKKHSHEADYLLSNYGIKSINTSSSSLKNEIQQFVNELKSKPYKYVYDLIQSINNILESTKEEPHIDYYMNWDQIREMSKFNICFESHAHSHKILTRLENDDVKDELLKSAEIIGRELDKVIRYIAYPNGDSNTDVQKIAHNSGYLLGFGTEPGLVSNNTNFYNIKRINIHEKKSRNIPLLMMSILGYY